MDDDWDFDEAALAAIDKLEKDHVMASQGSSQGAPPACGGGGGGLADQFPEENHPPQQPVAASSSHAAPPPAAPTTPSSMRPSFNDDLVAPLSHFFGFDAFRSGQEDAVRGVLSGRDVCVYWPTGQGKSVCYQLPALVANKVVVVVSPLVSLMVDQCAKLNNTVGSLPQFAGNPPAIFLGPHQKDHALEERALKGQGARVIYCSPEKLMMSNLMNRLGDLHREGQLLLIAIDEAHCVSAWGHDFRAEYQQLGVLRQRLPSVPILALTATAVPAVQADIQTSLAMRSPIVLRQSAFRDNLSITCLRKLGGLAADLQPLVDKLQMGLRARGAGSRRSTIVYCPTVAQCQQVHAHLSQRCAGVAVELYHGSLTPPERESAHLNFLSGKSPTIVATVAFGMGIDKPDIRSVVHYGAPKTVEDYYQQIGRAGRDGNAAECTLIANDADFTRYQADFYIGKLPEQAKAATIASIDRLRAFFNQTDKCRWVELLGCFQERAPFASCGTCDCCKAKKEHAGDLERDFGAEALVLMTAVRRLPGKAWTYVEKELNDKASPAYALRTQLKFKRATAVLKEFVQPLVAKGYLGKRTIKGGYGAFEVIDLLPAGSHALSQLGPGGGGGPLMLPVPEVVRRSDKKAAEEAAALRKQVEQALQSRGVDAALVPEAELQPYANGGPVTDAILAYTNTIAGWRARGQDAKADAHEELLERIRTWRQSEAERLRLAPASVLPDHQAMSLVKVKPQQKESLQALGVRVAGAAGLLAVLDQWRADQGADLLGSSQEAGGSQGGAGGVGGAAASSSPAGGSARPLPLPPGRFQPAKPWALAKPPPAAGKKPAAWEESWRRFTAGEGAEAIALQQPNGKAIQTNSVVGHLMVALTQGRPVDLHRLATFIAPPTLEQWECLREAEDAARMDVVADEKAQMTKLLAAFLPAASTEFANRTPQEKALLEMWYGRCHWYMALRRVGFEPAGADPNPKRARVG